MYTVFQSLHWPFLLQGYFRLFRIFTLNHIWVLFPVDVFVVYPLQTSAVVGTRYTTLPYICFKKFTLKVLVQSPVFLDAAYGIWKSIKGISQGCTKIVFLNLVTAQTRKTLTLVFQNPPNTFWGGVWNPKRLSQEVVGGPNIYSGGIWKTRLYRQPSNIDVFFIHLYQPVHTSSGHASVSVVFYKTFLGYVKCRL